MDFVIFSIAAVVLMVIIYYRKIWEIFKHFTMDKPLIRIAKNEQNLFSSNFKNRDRR